LLFFHLSLFCIAALTHRPYPSYAMSNSKDAILTWLNNRENLNTEERRYPGVSGFHSSRCGWTCSALSADTFALASEGVLFGDPKFFETDAWLDGDNVFHAAPASYSINPSSTFFDDTLYVDRQTTFLSGANSYSHVYTLKNLRKDRSVSLDLLDVVIVPASPAGSQTPTSATYYDSDMGFRYKTPTDSSASSLWTVSTNMDKSTLPNGASVSHSVAPAEGNGSPFDQFSSSSTHTLNGNDALTTADSVAVGTSITGIVVEAGKTVSIKFTRSFTVSSGAYASFDHVPDKDEYFHITGTDKLPSNDGLDDFYRIALLSMRHSQNPTLGTFVASFHPAYLYKEWARDAVFSAMIMDSAGDHKAADLFLRWLANANLRSNNGKEGPSGFHTCYDWWTGVDVGFVEPQYDSAGAALMAYYYHYTLTNDSSVLNYAQSRIRELESFFLQRKDGLVEPDYSIWEESSDGHTGDPIAPSHFTFTHSLAYGGLVAASLIEKRVFNNNDLSKQLQDAASLLQKTLDELFWHEECPQGPSSCRGWYVRGLMADTHAQDLRLDGSTTAAVFTGACKNATRARMHLNKVQETISHLEYGISRYENDPFFYDSMWNPGGKEVGAPAPPWGVATMFTAWAELHEGSNDMRQRAVNRAKWMVKYAAPHNMPVGECIDGVSGEPVMSSSPDLYEHAGVFMWTYLILNGRAKVPDPTLW